MEVVHLPDSAAVPLHDVALLFVATGDLHHRPDPEHVLVHLMLGVVPETIGAIVAHLHLRPVKLFNNVVTFFS